MGWGWPMKSISEPSKNWQLNASNESSKIILWVWKTHLRFIPFYPHLCSSLSFIIFSPFEGHFFMVTTLSQCPIWILSLCGNIFLGCILCPPFLWFIFFHLVMIWLFHILLKSLSPSPPDCELLHRREVASLISASTEPGLWLDTKSLWNEWV